ncbi:hypothetical protein [Brevibacillus sp. 179-C9.3 HS]
MALKDWKNSLIQLQWWEETGENAPDSWASCWMARLHGSMKKAKPRPK